MPSFPIITLNGKKDLNNQVLGTSTNFYPIICSLADFIFNNVTFLTLTYEIFVACYNNNLFDQKADTIIELNKNDYDQDKLDIYIRLIQDFYKFSLEVDNDRGRIIEKLCELALRKHYKEEANPEIGFHCKVSARLDELIVDCDKRDIDICAKVEKRGDYLESKRGLTGISANDHAKMKALTKLRLFLERINTQFGMSHNLYVFVLTNRDKKMKYYQDTWPEMFFIGIDEFIQKFY